MGANEMKKSPRITCLFVDIGGVLLTDGWNHHARKRAAKHFKLDYAAMDERHRLTFDTYEQGHITLDDYLDRVVFYEKRSFTHAQFRKFMFAQSQAFPDMLALISELKARRNLKIVVVSNEGRELNAYRIAKFKLTRLVDFFVSSSFVGLRKPDAEILHLALDLAQVPLQNIVYLENTPMFAQVAEELGIRTILHTDCESTSAQLAAVGLV
jgi:putative hydrolase of the HAD superfamily